jgi:acetyl esterase/lipase
VPYLSNLESAPVAGVAPAVVIAGDDPADDGHRYAARLRRAGVAVDVLRDGPARALDLARAACGA